MDKYFFHLHECGSVIADPEGCDLPDLATARAKAVVEARHVMSAEVLEGRLCLGCCIVVADGFHNELLRLPFREAVAVSGIRPD